MRWGVFKQTFVSLRIIYFVHVLLDCNLFEISISYGFRNIKTINSLCRQPSAQLIVTLIQVVLSLYTFSSCSEMFSSRSEGSVFGSLGEDPELKNVPNRIFKATGIKLAIYSSQPTMLLC